jgi:leader peptidase (prepilin peptidase) / N-methyltransferase
MAVEGHDVRRVDIGDGIFVAAPGAAALPAPERRSTRVPPLAWALGAGLGVIGVARLGITAEGLLAAALLPVLVALAAVDLRVRVLPNRIIGPALLAVLAWQIAFQPDRVLESVVAALAAGVFLLLPCLVQPNAMGMGDVKLGALLGLALGANVVTALMVGFVLTVPVALALLVAGGTGARRTAIPLGPFLGVGAAVVLLV